MKNSVVKIWCFLVLIFFVGVSCKDDKPESKKNPDIIIGERAVYITNEGNFQFGNAAISFYAPQSDEVVNKYFENVNNRALGDVCQSIFFFNGKAYIILNNSAVIEVVNAYTFVSEATITGFTSPRYFLPVSHSKAYVSDLYANSIAVVDLSSHTINNHINCQGWTEEMLYIYGKAYVTNQSSDYVYVIDAALDKVIDSIDLGIASNSIVEDYKSRIWVLGNDLNNQKAPRLFCINPVTNEIEENLSFENKAQNPWRLKINATRDTLYFLNDGVFRMPVTNNSLPDNAFIQSEGKNFYGLGICPFTSDIYVSDAVDYVQQGIVFRYNSNGELLTSFHAGIIPGDFWFR